MIGAASWGPPLPREWPRASALYFATFTTVSHMRVVISLPSVFCSIGSSSFVFGL